MQRKAAEGVHTTAHDPANMLQRAGWVVEWAANCEGLLK